MAGELISSHSQFSQVLSFTMWSWLLLYFMEWDFPSIT